MTNVGLGSTKTLEQGLQLWQWNDMFSKATHSIKCKNQGADDVSNNT
jgi:hypothetical protein